jgi:hypothetical protein
MSKIYHLLPPGDEPHELRRGRSIMGLLVSREIFVTAATRAERECWKILSPIPQPLVRYAQITHVESYVITDPHLEDVLPQLTGSTIRICADGSVYCMDHTTRAYVRVVSINQALDLVSARKIDHQTAWAALGIPGSQGRDEAMARVIRAMADGAPATAE